ncbi:MAG: FliH/SctL family protein [Burkholderiaceae bacterium]
MTAPLLWMGSRRDLRVSGKIIKKDDWVTLSSAVDLLQNAEQANAAAASERSQALRNASESGYAEGLEQGRMAGLQEVLRQTHASEQFVASLAERLVSIAESAVMQFVGQVGEKERLQRQLAEAVEIARSQEKPRLLVAPISMGLAQSLLDEITPGGRDWIELESDASLEASDVILECRQLIVDGRLKTRLARWHGALEGALKRDLGDSVTVRS